MPINEIGTPDHLILVVHGIGEFTDTLFRSLVECTNDMRNLSLKMTQKHFKTRDNHEFIDSNSQMNINSNGHNHNFVPHGYSLNNNHTFANSQANASEKLANRIEYLPG